MAELTGKTTAISFIMHMHTYMYHNHRLKAFTKFDRRLDETALIIVLPLWFKFMYMYLFNYN